MKKFAKMSLAAAVAVVGMTSASAASLEEAIKGVDISGQFRFRFNEHNQDSNTNANTSDTDSDVEVEVTAKVPVNDMVTAVIKIDNASDDADTGVDKDDVTIEDYYFQYVNGAVTVLAGNQNIPGRITDGAEGNGVVALYNAGAFTVGAAAFANHDVHSGATQAPIAATVGVDGSEMVLSAIAMGSVGPVSLLGQYADVNEVASVYNVMADASFGPAKVGVEYTALDPDNKLGLGSADDYETIKAYVSGSVGIVSAKLAYAKTGDNGSGSLDNAITKDSIETPAEWMIWNLGTAANADMDVWAIDASIAVTDKISLRAAYADGEIGNLPGNDVDELLGQISYKMSSNLNTYIRYSTYDNSGTDNNDNERARVEVQYTF